MNKPVENYLYFTKGGTIGNGARDGACWPASTFLSAQYNSATTTRLKFEDNTTNTIQGATTAKFGFITISHANISTNASIHMDIAKAMAKIISNPGRGKVIQVVDSATTPNGGVAEEFESLNNTTQVSCSAISVTQ